MKATTRLELFRRSDGELQSSDADLPTVATTGQPYTEATMQAEPLTMEELAAIAELIKKEEHERQCSSVRSRLL